MGTFEEACEVPHLQAGQELGFRQQSMPDALQIYVDSDFAGSRTDRKSTTGMVQTFGTHMIKASSNLQSVVGLKVSESEFYALVHGASYALGLQAYFLDIGIKVGLVIIPDSTSAKSFASRRGLGKQRHVMTRFLWLQQVVAAERVCVKKVHTSHNCSDVLTKHADAKLLEKHCANMGLVEREPSKLQKIIK